MVGIIDIIGSVGSIDIIGIIGISIYSYFLCSHIIKKGNSLTIPFI